MQNGIETTQNGNALNLVGDYVLPEGMINFNSPANMVMEYMIKVQANHKDEELKATLKAITEAAKVVVSAGVAQVEQGKMMIELLRANKELKMLK